MKRWPIQSREYYEAIQRERTQVKWAFNGVTREEVEWYHRHAPSPGPILCLGVRNGLEVDLFREVYGVEVQGVELHPQGKRPDVWVGSFDAMPTEWARRFALLYSNALDHAYDPAETAREWCRVAQPGATLALTIDPHAEPSATDPIADITTDDIEAWFGGHICGNWSAPGYTWRVLWRLP